MKKNCFAVSLALLVFVGSFFGAALYFTAFAEISINNDNKKGNGGPLPFGPTSPPSESYYQNKTGSTSNALGVSLRESITNEGNPLYRIDNFNSLTNRTFGIDCPKDSTFNSTFTNITITNIVAPNNTLNVEIDDTVSYLMTGKRAVAGFKIYNKVLFANFSTKFYRDGDATHLSDIRVRIFNSTWNLDHNEPDDMIKLLINTGNIKIEDINGWYNGYRNYFSPFELDPSNTDNNTFFIELYDIGDGSTYWRYIPDSVGDPSDMDAYEWDTLNTEWDLILTPPETIDFSLKVMVAPIDNTPRPTDIGLLINGTAVTNNGTSNSGFWISNVPKGSNTGRLNFTISSSWLDIRCNITRIQVNYTKTNLNTLVKYNVSKTDPRVQWNVSITTAIDDFSSKFLCHRINFSIPIDWDSSTVNVFNGTKGSKDINSIKSIVNGYRQIEVLDAGNGTNWYLTCNSTNLLDTESSVQFLEYNAPITTASYSSVVDIKAIFNKPIKTPNPVNLSVYWPSNYTTKTELYTKLNSSIPNRVSTVLLGSWNVSKNVASNQFGNFCVQVFWTNGTAVGYREKILKIVPEKNTVLTPALGSSTSITVTRGVSANYSFYYNTSGDNKAVESAIMYNISVPSGFKAADGYPKYEGDGRYKISLNTSQITNGVSNAEYTFTVARSGYVGQTKTLTITVEIPNTRIESLTSSISGNVAAEGQNITLQFKVYDDFKNKPILTISEKNITVQADGIDWDRADPKFANRGWLLQTDGKGNYTLVISTYQLSKGVQYTIVINVSYASLNPGPYQSSIIDVQFYYASVPLIPSGDDDDNGGGGNGGTTGVPIEQLILWIVVIAAIVGAIGIAAVAMKKATHKKSMLKKANLIQANTLMKDALNIRYIYIISKSLNRTVFANFYSGQVNKAMETKYMTNSIDIVKRMSPSDPMVDVFIENTNYLIYNSSAIIVQLVLKEAASSYLKEKLKRFAVDFEHQYSLKLGDMKQMMPEMPRIAKMIDKYFDTSLAQPYTLNVIEDTPQKFSSLATLQVLKLAEKLYDDAEKRTSGQPHFYLTDLISTSVKQRLDLSEALSAIRELIDNGVMIVANVSEEERQTEPSELEEIRDKIRGGPSEDEITEVSKLLMSLNMPISQAEEEIKKFKTMIKKERIRYVDKLNQALGKTDKTEVVGYFESDKDLKKFFLNALNIGKKALRSKVPDEWTEADKVLNNALKEAQKQGYDNLINDFSDLLKKLWIKGLNHNVEYYISLGDTLLKDGSYKEALGQYLKALSDAEILYNKLDESEKYKLNNTVDYVNARKAECEQKIRQS